MKPYGGCAAPADDQHNIWPLWNHSITVYLFLIVLALLLNPHFGVTATFYIDPVTGSDTGDGSANAPWKSLQTVVDQNLIESRDWNTLPYSESSRLVVKNPGAPVKAGDTVFLRSGSYGELVIQSYYNAAMIHIAAEHGHVPLFSNITIRSGSNWTLSGLSVNPSTFPGISFSNLISLESHGYRGPIHDITVKNCQARSVTSQASWSRSDWNNKAKNGIRVDGKNMKVIGNHFTNVNFGISVTATHSLVEYNTVTNFTGDGMRGLGDYTTFQYNRIANCYDVNDNHDDGFQSWSVGSDGKVGTGVVKGIILRANTIINYEDVNQPFRGTLQGIGCFDGIFEDWIVEKNIVEVDHWHGISLYGSRGATIRDNIVTDPNGADGAGPGWIMLHDHKNGTPSLNNEVFCNIAPKILIYGVNNQVFNNTLSETGGPRNRNCPALAQTGFIIPLLLDKEPRP